MSKKGTADLGVSLESVTATEAKNSLGAIIDRVAEVGKIAITRHDQVRAVVLSPGEYRALVAEREESLESLRAEFDVLVQGMQTPKARAAGRALFEASGNALGRTAVRAHKRR